MSARFTPGPWEAKLEAVRFVIQSDGVIGKRALAYTGGSEPANPFNARLIAAAPDLYAAAERALNYIANTEGELAITLESGDMLRAALAKARGETA